MNETNIVTDVLDVFRAAGFEVREDNDRFAIVGSIDSAGILMESVLEHFGQTVSPAPAAAGISERVRAAMKRAFNLGQTYWQQADSEYAGQNKKADVTAGRFIELTDETCADVERLLGAHAGVVAEPAAWMHEDGRVVTAATMNGARKDGGAMLSSLRGYTIPLYAAPAAQSPVQNAEEVRRAALEESARYITQGNDHVYDNGWVDAANERARCAAAIRALASKEAAAEAPSQQGGKA